ncbi:hypothetical protein TFLX_01623 [Thermoflexales bacterium]|nr:hypothetical protein TFLX_01623 [Thermoflexales bacterium]
MIINTKHRSMWLAMGFLLLTILACSTSQETTPTPAPTPTTAQVAENNPTPTATTNAPATPTVTVAPDVTAESGCTLNASYVADVTIPDDTQFAPGAAFVKTWRLRNSGSCEWETGSQLVFSSGDPLGGPTVVSVPALAPGSTLDISVNFVAPNAPGTYRSTWQMQSPEGTRYGSQIYAQIIVPAPVTPTFTPGPADLVITNLVVDAANPQKGAPLHIVATIRNQGNSVAANFHWAWRMVSSKQYIEAPDTLTLGPGEETTAQLEFTFNSQGNYTTDAVVDSRTEIAESDEGNNGRQLALSVSAAPSVEPTTLTLHRTARSGEATTEGRGTRLRAGINSAGKGFRAFLDFDLAELPGLGDQAQILDADLNLHNYSGDCFEFLGPLHIHHVNYGGQINSGDYNSGPQSTVLSAASSADIFNPLDITARIQGFVEHEGAGHYQLRLQLKGDNLGKAYACLMEWSDATLIVKYKP